ncbi:PREDICTED: uncharacterized protein LOC109224409 [Nicotiana attenuata]|uniref:Single-stranded DNA binding protein Ssb-like OB fold domain-containing protein n=1 Tax=Nicotiana attenuata TaxID=49451 RepID=A0A1J6IJM8_NICAT|nr:PREDICTED: uncharacterized protein LOC109224409 [Nicotiana attenuata]OIT05078.1 hypothetical protein A4A49_65304 [Nicotiana attenuata]
MAEQKKQQMGSKKVNQLRPSNFRVNITVKVISKKPIVQRNCLAECLVGDETGIIIFTVRNDQGVTDLNDFAVFHCCHMSDFCCVYYMLRGSRRMSVLRFIESSLFKLAYFRHAG